MTPAYPNDADGDVLRSLAASGSDMSRPMKVEFFVAFPSGIEAFAFEQVARAVGYEPRARQDFEGTSWTCGCVRSMVATYDSIVAAQAELDELARPQGGHIDGWETAGNA